METRWHVPVDLKLSAIKIKDRFKELHISATLMSNITSQLTRVERTETELKAEEDKKCLMKHVSDVMTKDWSDSIQKQQDKKRAHLNELLHEQENFDLIKYLTLKKEQEEDKKQFVDEMRQKIMVRQDIPKTLSSAYLFCEVLHGREKQKEFKNVMQQYQKDEELEEYKTKLARCRSFVIEEDKKKKKLKEKNYAYAEYLRGQMTQLHLAQKKGRVMRIEEELINQQRARLEAERIEMARQEKVAKTRKYANDALMDFMEVKRIEREKELNADKESEKLAKIVQKSNDRILLLMKMRKQEITAARFAKGANAFNNCKQLAREADIKLIYDRAFAKFEANERSRNELRAAKQVQLQREREEQQKQYLIESKAKKMHEGNVLKWEMMNRFKNINEKLSRVDSGKRQHYENREDLVKHRDKDVQLKIDRIIKDDHTDEEFPKPIVKYESVDNIYLKHAEELKTQAIENGWNTHPIDVVISNYRQKMMEEKRPNICKQVRKEL